MTAQEELTMAFEKAEVAASPFAAKKNRLSHEICDVEIVTATRLVVDTLLRGNINNRKVNKSNLNKLTEEFALGRYAFSGTPIIRDDYGILRDGQHRLMALAAAGYPQVPLLIITLHGDKSRVEEVYNCMDTGVSRKFGQLLQHKGCEDALKVAALCKKIPYIETGYTSYPVRPDSYYLDVLKLYRHEIEAIAPFLCRRGFRADIGVAACIIAKVTGCLEDIVTLCRRACNAEMLQIGTAEHTLHKIINDQLRACKKGQGSNSFYFATAAHCIIAYLNKERCPVVNRNIKDAVAWIKSMAQDNGVMIVPHSIKGSDIIGGKVNI